MAKQSEFDLATDMLKERIGLAQAEIKQRAKGVRPYRQVPISGREMLYNFSQITPDVIQEARLAMGNEAVDGYLLKMAKLARRFS